jgi:predicted helicase
MTIAQYIEKLDKRYKSGITTEHSFRGDLQNLLENLLPQIQVTNEPARIKCGAPDYILTKSEIPVGYIEAKDLGADLNSKIYFEQFNRYKQALNNLIITNYLDFQVYKDGELITTYSIGKFDRKNVVPIESQQEAFQTFIQGFAIQSGQTIKSSQKLAVMMANKAKMLALVINEALINDKEFEANSTLKEQLEAFKEILIHEITPKEFADIYAQTIAYGMFAARLHDPSLPTFTRNEAANLIPKSNPFLRKLFQYIAGYDLDPRIVWIVDALADIFRATDVAALLKNFGKATQQNDPIIHFYETFLLEYDPKLKKARGVWYTPEPVVKFIVRAVDDILKREFGLSEGLADTSKTKIKYKVHTKATEDRRSKVKEKIAEREVHKVQILDPATGTGTFLAEVIKYIYSEKFEGQNGIWSSYVENHLIPRLNGFELLMASYAMAHLKLDLLLTETGYLPTKSQRFRIYLTNSLEEHHPDTGTLFANWLSSEANEANQIKRDVPVMVVMGNPPYSGISSNNGNWIQSLIEDYKYIDGQHFNERKHWLNDDYVKFIRYGEHFIEKNGSGILAYINPHGYLENPTFRGMRWHLLKTFDKIITIDLHGNSKKKVVSPDGNDDENVFDIMQGVSINLFIKTGQKKNESLGSIFHFDLYGNRNNKYEFLLQKNISDIDFTRLSPETPNFFFIPNNYTNSTNYLKGFYIGELFIKQSMGITTARDHFVIDIDKTILLRRMSEFSNLHNSDAFIREKYFKSKSSTKYLSGDTRGWSLSKARLDLMEEDHEKNVYKIAYRPFDNRFIYYSKKMVDWGREEIMKNMLYDNVALVCVKIGRDKDAHNYFVSNLITDKSLTSSLDNCNIFPLYIYHEPPSGFISDSNRSLNLNPTILNEISKSLKLKFELKCEQGKNSFTPDDLFHYIYSILYSTSYREINKESLKIDFPRIPYPTDRNVFWKLVEIGGALKQLHLMESPNLNQLITKYPISGSNCVEQFKFSLGKIWINSTQYFDGIPSETWNFYIGGYQPALKWLKDRKGSELSYEDILHYQKIIKALMETEKLMKAIDKVIDFENVDKSAENIA